MFPAERAISPDSQQVPSLSAVAPRSCEEDVPLDRVLVDASRSLSGLARTTEIVVDCSPARLRIDSVVEPTVRRCVSLLIEGALASDPSPAELDVLATVNGGWESPRLLLSVRALALRSEHRWEPICVGLPHPTRITRIGAKPEIGTLLVTRCGSLESRFSLGLEVAARVPRQWPARVPDAPDVTVLLADDNPRARRACRRTLEAEGYVVREAARPLELVAQLDPDETGGTPPAWLLVDGAWVCGGELARPGIREVIEASMPADRVVLLGAEDSTSAGWIEAWRALPRPFAGSELLSVVSPSGPR